MTNRHPDEAALALLASGDCNRVKRFLLERHVRECETCGEQVAEFVALREAVSDAAMPKDLDWARLSAEMSANIHLGLEAGRCVRLTLPGRGFHPRAVVAFACLLVLVAAGLFMRNERVAAPTVSFQTAGQITAQGTDAATPVLRVTNSGLEVRSGSGSMTLLNRRGAVADQTVGAQGEIRMRYVDGEAGTVTINNVYLE
jgi:hypothetical protein